MSLRQSGGSERGAGAEGESSCEGRRKEAVGGTRMEPEQPPPQEMGSSLAPARGPMGSPCSWGAPGFGGGCRSQGVWAGVGGDGLGGLESKSWECGGDHVLWLCDTRAPLGTPPAQAT